MDVVFINLLPFYLMALVIGELLLLLREKKGLVIEISVALLASVVVTVLAQYQENSKWAAENRPVLLAVVNFISILIVPVVMVLANQYLIKIKNKLLVKHLFLIGAITITMLLWPIWALIITCSSGLDCL